MIVVGLTGGIGSGKSTVANIFSKLGIPIYDSDQRAKDLYTESEDLRLQMIQNFGSYVYTGNKINRKKLASIVFSNPEKLALLNSIVHPLLQLDFEDWKSQQKSKYVIREAAILIESGAYKMCNKVLVVTANKELRINRVMARDGASLNEVEQRINSQISDEDRMKYADFEIKNNGPESLIEQVVLIDENLVHLKG